MPKYTFRSVTDFSGDSFLSSGYFLTKQEGKKIIGLISLQQERIIFETFDPKKTQKKIAP